MNVKLASILLLSFLSIFQINAQNTERHKDMANVICECLENKKEELTIHNFGKTYADCKSSAVLVGLLSGIADVKQDTVVNIQMDEETGNFSSDRITEKDMNKVNEILDKDCEIFTVYRNTINIYTKAITTVTDGSCKCVEQVPTDTSTDDKNTQIKECITLAISDNDISSKIDLNTVEDLRYFYNYVSDNLVENCQALKALTFSADEEKLYSYSSNEKALNEYRKGLKASEQQDYKKAIKHYKKAVKIDKKFVFAWDNLGRSYRMIDKYDDAIESYETSLSIDPLNPAPIMNMAVAYNLKKDYDNAEKWYLRLIEVDRENPEGYYGLGLTFMNKMELEDSLNNIISAFELYKKQGSPYSSDARKVVNYLKGLFKKEGKLDEFRQICESRNYIID